MIRFASSAAIAACLAFASSALPPAAMANPAVQKGHVPDPACRDPHVVHTPRMHCSAAGSTARTAGSPLKGIDVKLGK